jgi:hypothetical protein
MDPMEAPDAAGEKASWQERLWWPYGALDQSKAAVWTACGLLALDAIAAIGREMAAGRAGNLPWLQLAIRIALIFFLFQGRRWARLAFLFFLVLGLIVLPLAGFLLQQSPESIAAGLLLNGALLVLLTGRGARFRVVAAGIVGLAGELGLTLLGRR